jgi:hypothetical protein
MGRAEFKAFGGIMPKVSPRNLPDMAAQTARNCWLAETTLEPINAPTTIQALSDANQKSIYLWRRGTGSEWLSWTTDVNVVPGPIADDTMNRIYYTDGTTLHMKYWHSDAKVEVDDVTKAAPSAPTIAKGLEFDPSVIRLWYKGFTGDTSDYYASFLGMNWNEDLLTVKFKLQSGYVDNVIPMSAAGNGCWHIDFTAAGGIEWTNGQELPINSATTDNMDLYSDRLPITLPGGSALASIQVLSIEEAKDINDVDISTSGSTTYYRYGFNITVTLKMNFARDITQYHYYVLSTIDPVTGQESPPSVPSARVTWGPNDKLTVSGTGRLYRSVSGSVDSDWFFVADITGTYVDRLTDSTVSLAGVMPNIENPPTAMTGLVALPGGFLAAFNGKDIYFSEPFLPYSWPSKYRNTLSDDIVGLAVSGNDLVILTKGVPVIAGGAHPEMMRFTSLDSEQSCVSKRSIAFGDGYVLYASPDGLCSVRGASVDVVTKNHYTRDQWNTLIPSTMIGSVHDRRYIGWLAAGGAIIVDFTEASGRLTTTDETALGVYSDLQDDTLYLIQGAAITSWMTAATTLTALWKSKEFQCVRTPMWSCAIVIATAYTGTTFRLYADGVLVATHVVTSNASFRLPKLARTERWSIEIETVDVIHQVVMGTSEVALRVPNPLDPVR